MSKEITSINNSYIKQLLKLQEKSRERKKSGFFLIEGERETQLALRSGYQIKTALFCPDYYDISLKMSCTGPTETSATVCLTNNTLYLV